MTSSTATALLAGAVLVLAAVLWFSRPRYAVASVGPVPCALDLRTGRFYMSDAPLETLTK